MNDDDDGWEDGRNRPADLAKSTENKLEEGGLKNGAT